MINRKALQQILLAALTWTLFLAPAARAGSLEDIGVDLGFEQFPQESTCEGEDISPQIEINTSTARSLAIIVEDADASSGSFIHWIIWNIPPTSIIPSGIAKSANITTPFPARQGYNDFGEIGYAGPCPPPGKRHRYFFQVFGLDGMLDLPSGASAADLREAMRGRILEEGQAKATFVR